VNYQPPQIARIGQLLRLALSTTADAEAVVALGALKRTMATSGIDLHALPAAVETGLRAPAPAADPYHPHRQERQESSQDWRAEAKFCHRHRDQLVGQEHGRIDTLMKWKGMPTPRQLDWLTRIVQRIRANQSGGR
jgi:hypothetical protein